MGGVDHKLNKQPTKSCEDIGGIPSMGKGKGKIGEASQKDMLAMDIGNPILVVGLIREVWYHSSILEYGWPRYNFIPCVNFGYQVCRRRARSAIANLWLKKKTFRIR
ncbi:hypothetical protein AMTRI_Chr09g17800 [Amborella trichopoda]